VHLLHPSDGFMRKLTPDTMGGWLLGRMTPFVIGGPIVLGWLRVEGERKGWFEGPLGVALMMIVMMFLLTLLVLQRYKGSRKLRQATDGTSMSHDMEGDQRHGRRHDFTDQTRLDAVLAGV
jgi:hypothetical protein